jgi:hypothetical protein
VLLFTAGELGLAFGWWDAGTAAVEEALLDAGASFVAELWQPMLWQSGLLVLLGLALWALSYAFPARRQPLRSTPPSTPSVGRVPADDVAKMDVEQETAGDADAPVDAVPEPDTVEASEAEKEALGDADVSDATAPETGEVDAPAAEQPTATDVDAPDAIAQDTNG